MTATDASNSTGRLDLSAANDSLADASAEDVIRWAVDAFGDGLVMTSSFGIQSALMLHLVTRISPNVPVIFIDTGYLFPETYQFVDDLTRRLDLNLKVYQSPMSPAWMEAVHGRLWEQDAAGDAKYQKLRKLEPMQRALKELNVTAWLAGLRRQQTRHRSGLATVEAQDGLHKVHPILDWTNQHVHAYLKEHELPYHPLWDKNYATVGDTHSSRPLTADDLDERDTRFNGLKQECGLHLPTTKDEDDSRMGSGL